MTGVQTCALPIFESEVFRSLDLTTLLLKVVIAALMRLFGYLSLTNMFLRFSHSSINKSLLDDKRYSLFSIILINADL